MLVLAPEKRFTVEQVKKHRWMVAEGPPRLLPSANPPSGEPNEQILRLMQSLGIDAAKTKEVRPSVLLLNSLFLAYNYKKKHAYIFCLQAFCYFK
jgi:hypothetical protein